eukprot:TRINITY_DN662_c0_g1_i1.p1 TRINITY_DN662_c0_g1~~TRINITY_DN662_c0_g1_i1.p1  ORF type:complete len:263 (-),score=61.19 TRINITY_DN662_c0_g1_i1:948-1655(-)
MATTGRTAVIVGATGLVGGFVLKTLLADSAYSNVISLVRRAPKETEPAKLTSVVVDFDNLSSAVSQMSPTPTDAYCCLGTTIKKAGSKEAFAKVDKDYVVGFAQAAKAAGAKNFAICSAVGADPKSSIFYSRVKGEAEDLIASTGFDSTTIFHPSLILGDRQESRIGEAIAMKVMPGLGKLLFHGGARKYRAVEAEHIAQGMVAATKVAAPGLKRYFFDEIESCAEQERKSLGVN